MKYGRIAVVALLVAAALVLGAGAASGWTEKQEAMHSIAEIARAQGLDEDNPIIVEAKRIWQEEHDWNEKWESIGEWKITGYDACAECCGWTTGITASGTQATVGRTIAVRGYPFGTHIYIDGLGEYIVEDRCGGEGIIDVFCNNHSECYSITGKYQCWIMKGEAN